MKANKKNTSDHLKIAESIIAGWGENYSVTYEVVDGVQKITFSSVSPVTSREVETVKSDEERVSAIDEAIESIREKLGTKPIVEAQEEPTPSPEVKAQEGTGDALSEAVKSIRDRFSKKTPKKAANEPTKARKRRKPAEGTLTDENIPSGTILGGVYKGDAKFVSKVVIEEMDGSKSVSYSEVEPKNEGFSLTGRTFNTLSGAAKGLCGGKPINGFRFFRLNWEGFKRGDDLTRVSNSADRAALAKAWREFPPLEVLSPEELKAKLDEIKAKKKAAREAKKAAKN